MAKIAIDIKEGKIKRETLIIGIDLGTTNSLVAYVDGDQQIVVRDDEGSSALVPSVIHFDENDQPIVGQLAKSKLITSPERTIYSIKRLMGKSYKDVQERQHQYGYTIIDDDPESLVKIKVGNRYFNPIQLSAEILKALKERVESKLGAVVTKAVITVPAYFNDAQRQATRDAGKLAGLDVLRIVNEPTAASLAYGLDSNTDEGKTIAVYDLGGGTFDISLLRIENGIFEVLSTHGDTFLGGDDFDQAVIEYWLEQLGGNLEDLKRDKSLSQAIRLAAEEAKIHLTDHVEYQSSLNGYEISITRNTFEALILPLVQRTLASARQALRDARLAVMDVDHVVLVGGSTRVPLVKREVEAFFQQKPNDKINPDEVVALGAAIQANILAGNEKGILLLDVTPLSLGIETVGGLMDVIIPRNSKIPSRAGRKYTTSVDGQKNLKISVYQGERDLVEHNRKLGEFILRGIPPMPAGIPKIEIHFILNADGILQVKAQESRSKIEQSIEIRSQYGISEEDMAKMLLESIQHAQEDMDTKALIEAQNEGNYILMASDKFIDQNASWMDSETTLQIQKLTTQLKHDIQQGTKDQIQASIDRITQYTEPLAHRALDKSINEALSGKKVE